MSSWIQAMNPTAPITTEAEAEKAARSSAISIFIGVIVGIISVVYLMMNPQIMADAMAQASAQSPEAAEMAGAMTQITLWTAAGMVVLQLIFGFFQWRRPNKVIAIIFILLIIYGILSTAAAPMMAASMPNVPVTPMWQIVLGIVIMIIQLVLHFAGIRGISALNRIQMDAAR